MVRSSIVDKIQRLETLGALAAPAGAVDKPGSCSGVIGLHWARHTLDRRPPSTIENRLHIATNPLLQPEQSIFSLARDQCGVGASSLRVND
jgi:hypothetical protein